MRRLLLAGLICMLSATASAKAEAPRQEAAIWAGALVTLETPRRPPSLALWLDAHLRRSEAGTLSILRPGVGVTLAPGVTATGGYAHVALFADAEAQVREEHRFWQQLALASPSRAGWSALSRSRLEERLGAWSGLALRIRQLVRLDWRPRADLPRFVLWDELFVGLSSLEEGPVFGYDQNRIFVGVGLQIDAESRIELGYLAVHARAPERWVHVLSFTLFSSLRP